MLIPPYPPSVNFVEGPNDPETSGDVLATPPRRLKPLGFSLRMALWWSLVDGGLGKENHGIYGLNWGFPKSWGYPNSWMVYYGHPNLKWMMIGATPNFFRNPPICLHQRCTGWQCAKDSHHACHSDWWKIFRHDASGAPREKMDLPFFLFWNYITLHP